MPSCGFTAKTPLNMMRGGKPTLEMVQAQKGFFYKIGLSMFGWIMVQTLPVRARSSSWREPGASATQWTSRWRT